MRTVIYISCKCKGLWSDGIIQIQIQMLIAGVNGSIPGFLKPCTHKEFSPEQAAVVKLSADFYGFYFFFNAFQQRSQTRRVIVTPLCSSSAAVAHHRPRLVPRAETRCLHPTAALLSRCGGRVMGHICPPPPPGPETYCNAETRLMLRLEPICGIFYLQFVEPQHVCLYFQWKHGLKSPLLFL